MNAPWQTVGRGFAGALAVISISAAATSAADRPNVLIIIGDDCTVLDLPLYGGRNAKTPHIDRLASEGMTFNRAYVGMSMCVPCRAEMYTGQYAVRNGTSWNHSSSRPGTRSLPHHLGAMGYRVGLTGKYHVTPETAFPFEILEGFDSNCVRDPTLPHSLDGIREFMRRTKDQPFCLVVGLVEPHVPWVMGDASAYPPKKIELPPTMADTLVSRQEFGRYLAEITYMDAQVGEILGELEASGAAPDTLVFFTSEQGAQFPGCKWTCWDSGLRTALVARWPGRVPAGRRADAMVQYADVLPTLVELAGGNPAAPEYRFDGVSFTAALRGGESRRTFAYGMHNNIPEGPPYPIRTVTDGTWRFIRNLSPDCLYIEKHLMGPKNLYWPTWLNTSWDRPETYALIHRYMRRPAEELYHTAADPYELTNLAGDPRHAKIQARLSAELDRWMKDQGDPGAPLDTLEAWQASKDGRHLYGPN